MSRTLVIDGHPNPDSLCSALARAYVTVNPAARLITLRDLDFDLHMRHGYTKRMPMEPDLTMARQAIRDAEHLVVVTPVWWRSVPALLKGFLDRTLLPKEDFSYSAKGLPVGHLTGRSAHVIATADTPLWLQPFLPDTRLRSLTRGTLAFCGFGPVRVTRFAPVNKSTAEQRAGWLRQIEELGRSQAGAVADPAPAPEPLNVG